VATTPELQQQPSMLSDIERRTPSSQSEELVKEEVDVEAEEEEDEDEDEEQILSELASSSMSTSEEKAASSVWKPWIPSRKRHHEIGIAEIIEGFLYLGE